MTSVNVSKSTAKLFAKTTRRVQSPRPPQLFGEPIQWVETARYLGVTLDTLLTWSARRLGLLSPLLNSRSGLSLRNGVLLYKQLISPMMDYACPIWGSAAYTHTHTHTLINYKCCNPSAFALGLTHPDTLVTSKSTSIWGFHSSPTTSEH
jgi:hypothetical protein